jgi:hypothetical protein
MKGNFRRSVDARVIGKGMVISASARFRLLLALCVGALAAMVGSHGCAFKTSASQGRDATSRAIALPEILAIELPAAGMT